MDSIPQKRHRLTDWICKLDPAFCCMQETHLSEKDRHYLRVKGWKTIFQANGPKKKAGVAILISNKIDLSSWIFSLFTFQMFSYFQVSPSETLYPITPPPASMRMSLTPPPWHSPTLGH